MSRGLGRVQRAVLEHLAGEPAGRSFTGAPNFAGVTSIARVVYGTGEPTNAQRASVRRAVRTLEAAGLVETWRSSFGATYTQRRPVGLGYRWWYGHRIPDTTGPWRVQITETGARRALSPTERATETQMIDTTVTQLVAQTPAAARRTRTGHRRGG